MVSDPAPGRSLQSTSRVASAPRLPHGHDTRSSAVPQEVERHTRPSHGALIIRYSPVRAPPCAQEWGNADRRGNTDTIPPQYRHRCKRAYGARHGPLGIRTQNLPDSERGRRRPWPRGSRATPRHTPLRIPALLSAPGRWWQLTTNELSACNHHMDSIHGAGDGLSE